MIYARRYNWADVHPYDNTALLDAFVAHPEYLPYPMSPESARASWAAILTDPANILWTTYSDRDLTGVVMLTQIMPPISATFDFMFLDKEIAAKRQLLRNIIGYCFTDLGLQRLVMYVPDREEVAIDGKKSRGVRMERFARKVLGFRLEGEGRPRNHELPDCLTDNWVARQGSRREHAYFDGEHWLDILVLRLLASEWVGA